MSLNDDCESRGHSTKASEAPQPDHPMVALRFHWWQTARAAEKSVAFDAPLW
jgi:hypothetical protein